MSLEALANLAQVVGAVAVVAGIAFGWYQVRQFRAQQRDAVVAELCRTFYSRDLANAVRLLYSLPDGVPAAELRARGSEFEEAAIISNTAFETMGLLVFRRIAPFDVVVELAGGMITVTWRKVAVWIAAVRLEQSQPSWAEWFEWLAHQVAAEKSKVEPAHVRFRDWSPAARGRFHRNRSRH
jgi:hypothetical protein